MTARALAAFTAGAREAGKLCAICQTAIERGAQVGRCPECESPFHTECWDENGGCATYGCALMPATVKEEGELQPQTHWGQEEKSCPRCNERIKVAAVRCKHCKAVFESAAPMSRADYFARERQRPLLDDGRRAATLVFIAGLLPCTAPVCLVVGGTWALVNRATLAKLPGTHRVLCWVGIGAAGVTTTALLLAAAMVR